MKRLVLPLGLGLALLSGCAHQYVMKLSNGMQITSASRPQLKGANYHYKDAKGQDHVIPQSRVQEIEPASQARAESQFTPQKPKKKHWYWPF